MSVAQRSRGSHRGHSETQPPNDMLNWTLTFLVFALIAALFGFTSIAASFAGIAKILFFVFLVLLVLSFLFGRRKVVVQ